MNIQPLGKNVLIAENKKSETTSAGIILEGGGHESKMATVVAVGTDVTKVATGTVVFPDWSEGDKIMYDGVQRVILNEDHILAIVV